jgi:hypothetical protein
MGTTKRLGVTCLLLIALGLAGTAAARAADIGDTIRLTPYVAGASGTARLSDIHFEGWDYSNFDGPVYWEWYYGNLTITCSGLKPKTVYYTAAGGTKTDRYGNFVVTNPHAHFVFGWWTDDGVNWFGPGNPGNDAFDADVRDTKNRRVLYGAYDYMSLVTGPVPGDSGFDGTPVRQCPLP